MIAASSHEILLVEGYDSGMHTVTGNVSVFVEIVSAESARMNVSACIFVVVGESFAPAVDETSTSGYLAGHDARGIGIAHFTGDDASLDVVELASARFFPGVVLSRDVEPPCVCLMRNSVFAAVGRYIVRCEDRGNGSGKGLAQLGCRSRADEDGFRRVEVAVQVRLLPEPPRNGASP